jgi:hypothetical protein
MPRGKWSEKRERQYQHIRDSEKGVPRRSPKRLRHALSTRSALGRASLAPKVPRRRTTFRRDGAEVFAHTRVGAAEHSSSSTKRLERSEFRAAPR